MAILACLDDALDNEVAFNRYFDLRCYNCCHRKDDHLSYGFADTDDFSVECDGAGSKYYKAEGSWTGPEQETWVMNCECRDFD